MTHHLGGTLRQGAKAAPATPEWSTRMAGISLLSALTDKLRWTQQRQDLLAQNVANADTPNYRGQELQPIHGFRWDTLDHLTLDPGTIPAAPSTISDPMDMHR